nr:NADH-quinone oxidoreductase subunit C [uncultured Cohaesibacter sp.]
MNHLIEKIEAVCTGFALDGEGARVDVSPQKLPSVWLALSDRSQFGRLATDLRDAGCRLATTTVYRPDPTNKPHRHEVAYHFLLEGLPVTVKLAVDENQALPSISGLYPNADWEERELMELCNVAVEGHPNPRRLFLDESIEAGVFDRYVPFSELTNLANADAVWTRIRADSRERELGEGENVEPLTEESPQ